MRYGIVGAGALGLTAGLRLVQRGHDVTIFERDRVLGGLAGSFEIADGVWLEKFYHHLFRTDRRAIALIRELGLAADLRWHRPRTTVFRDGEIHQLDSAASLLRFSPLSVLGRFRLAVALAVIRGLPSPALLEGHGAGAWMRRVAGTEAYETVWRPLLHGKFGDVADEVTMPWLWARIHDRTAELGYLRGGFHRLYEAVADRFEDGGGRIVRGAEATGIGRRGTGLEVRLASGTADAFDRVISTLPPALTARLVDDLPSTWCAPARQVAALDAHCLVLALDRPLTDAYWVSVGEPGLPFLTLVEHTNLVPPDAYGSEHLIYLGNYRPRTDPLFSMTVDEVLEAFEPGLRRIAPAFDRSGVRRSWTFAAPFAQPIVTTAFRDAIPPFVTPVPGLFLASMFQVYPHDRGQNYSIALAERLVAELERR